MSPELLEFIQDVHRDLAMFLASQRSDPPTDAPVLDQTPAPLSVTANDVRAVCNKLAKADASKVRVIREILTKHGVDDLPTCTDTEVLNAIMEDLKNA